MTVTAAPEPGLPRWQRSLLPAMLGADHADRGQAGASHLPRSARDWLVDVVLFLGATGLGVAVLLGNARDHAAAPLLAVNIGLGVASLVSLWVRRRHPAAVGALASVVSAVSGLAAGAALVAMFTVAVYCPPRRTLQLLALSLAAAAVFPFVYASPGGGYDGASLGFGIVLTLIAVAFGAFVRARRELVLSLHERNRQLQAVQQSRVAEAAQAERHRIAREMHDVLAHRISLLSVHAGALEFNPDATPEEVARAAKVIRESARAAQEELRDVIGVLRTGAEEEIVEPPQPTLADLQRLVRESRDAGMEVTLDARLGDRPLPATRGRTVYRLVQEALTNARKHAAGQVVAIELTAAPGPGIRLEATNRPRVGRAAVRPPQEPAIGSGSGLIGLGERVALTGGRLEHGPLPGGGFRLAATLPWPEEAE